MVSAYEWLLLAHLLLFVYWLGADLAVFHAAGYAADPSYSPETRVLIARIMGFVDLFPRLSVPLTGAVGVTLAAWAGLLAMNDAVLALVWAVALAWVAASLVLYARRTRPQGLGAWRALDLTARIAAALAATTAGAAALAGLGPTDSVWLALKLLIFAAAIFLSLVLRVLFRPYRPALARVAAGTGAADDDAVMQRSLARARPVVLGIWLLTVIAAALGLWKPFAGT